MSNIPEDIHIPLNTKRDKKNNKGLLGIGIPNSAVSLINFLRDKFKAANGITLDTSSLTFKLGGEVTEDVNLILAEGKQFSIIGANGIGFIIYEDGGNAIYIGNSTGSPTGLNIYPDLLTLINESELNILSNNLSIKAADNTNYINCYVDGTDYRIKVDALPVFADEAAAVIGGLDNNQLYKTATGELRIKL